MRIVESASYAHFSQEDRTGSLPCQVTYTENGLPNHITLEEVSYPVESLSASLDPRVLFDHSVKKPPHPFGDLTIWPRFKHEIALAHKAIVLGKLQNAHTLDIGDGKKPLHKIKAVSAALEEQTAADIQSVFTHGIEAKTGYIQYHRVRIPAIGNDFQHISLYDKKPDSMEHSWQIDETITASLIFAHQKLRVPPRQGLTFISIGLNNYPVMYQDKYSAHLLRYSNWLRQVLKDQGRTLPRINTAVLYERAKEEIETVDEGGTIHTRKVIRVKDDIFSARHETGHLADPYVVPATPPQAEGFARAFENDFSFEKCHTGLRRAFYQRDISQEQTAFLFGRYKASLPVVERYLLSATFFSYLYEQQGAEVMMDWYKYVSGAAQVHKDGTYVSLRCKLYDALQQALAENGKHSDEAESIVKDYVDRMNDLASTVTFAPVRVFPKEQALA